MYSATMRTVAMSSATRQFAHALFVSYAHADDHDGWVAALVEATRARGRTSTVRFRRGLINHGEHGEKKEQINSKNSIVNY